MNNHLILKRELTCIVIMLMLNMNMIGNHKLRIFLGYFQLFVQTIKSDLGEIMEKISMIGITICILYFITVGVFLTTKTEFSLTMWELFTIICAPVILLVLLVLSNLLEISTIYKNVCPALLFSLGFIAFIIRYRHNNHNKKDK